MAPHPPHPNLLPQRWRRNLCLYLLLALLFSMCFFVALHTGQTVDETFYNGSGYPMVRYNDYGFLGEHPPLMMQLGSLPLLAIQPKFPIKNPVYLEGQDGKDISETGSKFLYEMGNDPDQLLLLERIPIILVTVLLGFYLFRWSCDLFGMGGGLLSLTLFVFSPDILAHGSLFTTDMGLSAFFFIALFYLHRLIEAPHTRTVVLTGCFLGLALLTKISAVLLLPVTFFILLPFFLKPDERWEGLNIRALATCLGIYVFALILRQKLFMILLGPMILMTLSSLNLGKVARFFILLGWGVCFYLSAQLNAPDKARLVLLVGQGVLFLGSFLFFDRPNFQKRLAAFKLFSTFWLLAITVLALGYTEMWTVFLKQSPFYHYVRSFQIALAHTQSDHRICVEGSWLVCDWRYFLSLLTVKLPVATLFLTLTGTIGFFLSKQSFMRKWCVWIPTLVFLFVASFVNKLNIGVRHILPIYPFLFLIAGASWPWFNQIKKKSLKKGILGVGALLLLFSCLRVLSFLPHPLTYFNTFVGGARDGAKLVADSNLDWGQDNKRLALWAKQNQVPKISLALTTFNRAVYDYYEMPWGMMQKKDFENPSPGYYALSLSLYQQEQKNENSWFRSKEPLKQIGNTIYVFKVS